MKPKSLDKTTPIFISRLGRGIAWLISKPFWFIRFHGRENIPGAEVPGFLIAANHQTYIDPVWISIPIRHPVRFMAFDTAFEWRFIGPLISYLGAFPVSSKAGGTLKATKHALRALKDGALVVFPEGAREFADGNPLDFKSGAVHIARQAGVPILPVTVSGGNRIWPRKQKYPRLFRRVEITYHPLIHIAQDADIDTHTETLKAIITGQGAVPAAERRRVKY